MRGVAAAIEHRHLIGTLDIETCVDIGANIGQFSLLIRGLFPKAQIYAFEPLQAPAATWRSVMGKDKLARLFQLAVGPAQEERLMHVSARHDSSSLLPITSSQVDFAPGTQEVDTQLVKLSQLGTCLRPDDIRSAALLKLDVQGFELEALKGCEELLPMFQYVYVELSFNSFYGGQALAEQVIAWLAERRFTMSGINNPSYDRQRKIVQADFLFTGQPHLQTWTNHNSKG